MSDQAQSMLERDEKIKVFVRIRPQLRSEIGKEVVTLADRENPRLLRIIDHQHNLESQFNRVFDMRSTQREVFDSVQYCLDSVIAGFNSTIFAYGQTGSGKTYSIFGEGFQKGVLEQIMQREDMKRKGMSESETVKILKKSKLGVIPRAVSHVFSELEKNALKVTVYMSFLQIYNEQIFDLLGRHPGQSRGTEKSLRIREDQGQGIYVEGLTEYIVTNKDQCLELLVKGERIRAKRTTRLNMQSSRSHSIFQLVIESDEADDKGMLKRAKLNIGDLAGSEKIFLEEFPSAQHLNELKNINLSLTNLGKVISKLAKKTAPSHISFRDSKLTRLLQDSLGGNTRTCLLATISPTIDFIDETLSTIKFADRTKFVTMKVTKNEINAQDDILVQKLQKEISYLKDLLQMRRKGDKNSLQEQLFRLREENDRLRQIALSISDVEKLKQENKMMRLEMQKITNSSIDENDQNSDDESSSYINKQYRGADETKSVNSNQPFQRSNSILDHQNPLNTASEQMNFIKRTIQDTGATEDQELRDSVSQVNRALRIVDDESHSVRQPRKVIQELLNKQNRLRKQINQLGKEESEVGQENAIYRERNSILVMNQANSEEEEADFDTYQIALEQSAKFSKQGLNHSRNLAGLAVNRSAALDNNAHSIMRVQHPPIQHQTYSANESKQTFTSVKKLLAEAPEHNIIGLSKQSVEAYNLPMISGGSRNNSQGKTVQNSRTAFKSNRNNSNIKSEIRKDPYGQVLTVNLAEVTPTQNKNEVKRTLRYRAGNDVTRTEVKQQRIYSDALPQGQGLNMRRKSNGDNNTQRTRNVGMIGSIGSLNLARKSLPRLHNYQNNGDLESLSANQIAVPVSTRPAQQRKGIPAKQSQETLLQARENEEKRLKHEQELFYKRATERLMALEQMEQERKRRFEQELIKLQSESAYLGGGLNSQRGQQQQMFIRRNIGKANLIQANSIWIKK
ncbi:hypothetical protein FGO68_gene1664 [Halteria grandinella]|uniref:Kinesin motor domain-containing protein n=1 Tax=Halteria grandinella TaxID=5974 RepID=A0A8J8P2H2_HALGN|nr:hypothetical protein FGO68_gene1664 [Halteria grandinella]